MVDLWQIILIAVRIVLPVFCCMLIINVVLGVLAKAAPQLDKARRVTGCQKPGFNNG